MPVRGCLALATLLLVACASPRGPAVQSPVQSPTAAVTGVSPAPVPATPSPTPPPAPTPTPTPTPTSRPLVPVPAEDASALAAQLEAAERTIRDPSARAEDLAWSGHLQQLVYRRLVDRPALRAPLLAALPAELRAVAAANADAGIDLRALVTPREKQDLPRWRIIEPAPVDELLRYYQEAEAEFGIPWSYLAAIHLIETRMGRIRGTSVAGAQGPMQFMPATWAAFGQGDINSDRDSIRAAARYLRSNGAPANLENALFRYNNSQRYVRAVTAYAEIMRSEPLTLRGYHAWQVYYLTTQGDVLLPVGYRRD